ncbi:MAG: heme-dependent peroxidase [Planctomycetaceae bacterium]|nr:heme-dependent peroxidase [Planctomycetaceae bacterium]
MSDQTAVKKEPQRPAGTHSGSPAAIDETVSVEPTVGWHCTHSFYRFNRSRLAEMTEAERLAGFAAIKEALNDESPMSPGRLQKWIVPGHKADFAVMALDPSPHAVDGVHQRLLAGPLGVAIESTYSFVGLTEVSEYLPTAEQFAKKLVKQGEDPESASYKARVQGYAAREPAMQKARLEPDFPPWPCACFYPMNKKRKVGENWFTLPFSERSRLMAEHGASGMKFGGRVSQLITVSVGLDDWEWGVTLWARRPEFLKEIVYTMRFDEASARYAEFGPFYTGYVATTDEILMHCQLTS